MPKLILPAIMRVDDDSDDLYLYKAALEEKEVIEKLAGIKLIKIELVDKAEKD